MVLFVVTVALAVVLGTLANQRAGEWRRFGLIAVGAGIGGWLVAGAWVAGLAGVPTPLLGLVAVTLILPVREATLRALGTDRPPLRWATVASAGVAAAALEGYGGYQLVVVPQAGVDLDTIAGVTALATLTIAVTGVMALALHMRKVNPDDAPDLVPLALRRIAGPDSRTALARRFGTHARQLRVIVPWALSDDK
jgi:hypothetical protein